MRGRLLMSGEVEVYQSQRETPVAGRRRDLDIERLFAMMTSRRRE
jgi:hypothetical protein